MGLRNFAIELAGLTCRLRTIVKPRPNDRNRPTQHVATLLGATCCVRLATVLRHVATCWLLLAQIWPVSNLSQQKPTCRNTVAKRTQHVAPNNVATCCVGMLRSFVRGLRIKLTSEWASNVKKHVLKNRFISNYFMKAASSSLLSAPKLFFRCEISCKVWSCTTKVISISRCESLEIRLLYCKLSSRKRSNSTEFLLNTATIRKAKLHCICLLFA